MNLNLSTARILSISAHPDDEIGGAGGLLVQAKRAGAAIRLCLALDPSEERFDVSPEQEREQRLQEFAAVAGSLGAEHSYLGLLRFPAFTRENLAPIIAQIREFKPTMLLTPSDEENHADHRAIAALTKTANWHAGRQAFPNLGEPFRASMQLLYEADNPIAKPTFLLDISVEINEKVNLLNGYTSQISRKKLTDAVVGLNTFRGIMYKSGTHAEAYKLIELFYG